jgi:hypothetical protein
MSSSTISPSSGSATPWARPRCRAHTVSGSARAVVSNGQACSTMSTSFPRRVVVGFEPVTLHGLHQVRHRVAPTGRGDGRPCAETAPDLDRRIAAADDLRQHQGEPLVGTGDPPSALHRRVHRVTQSRSTTPDTRGRRFRDETGLDELGEMLTDGVVMQSEMLGQLRHVDRAFRVGDVTEHRVSPSGRRARVPAAGARSPTAHHTHHRDQPRSPSGA